MKIVQGWIAALPVGLCMLFAVAGHVSYGQQVDNAGQDTSAAPKLQENPLDALKRFEPDANEEYTLGAGDEITVEFPGHSELSGKHVVGPDGRITLSIAGPIEIIGLTREAAAQRIVLALSRYYTDLAATVKVEHFGSNHIMLLGNVKNPGVMNFDQTPTLLEALSRGGIDTRQDGAVPDRCVIYRGSDQVLWVDVRDLLESGNPMANLRLRRNDVVFVPNVTDRVVSVMGQVQHPGEVVLKRNTTLASVIGEAGGPTDGAGSNPTIQVVHRSKGGTVQYVPFKELLNPTGGLEVSLHPGDVIFVPKSGMAKVGFFMQQLAPFTTFATFAAIAH